MSIHKEVELAMTPQTFIALWLAINGGDPAPEPGIVLVGAAAVLQHLHETNSEAGELRGQLVETMEKALSSYR